MNYLITLKNTDCETGLKHNCILLTNNAHKIKYMASLKVKRVRGDT